MPGNESAKGERHETVGELADLIAIVQRMGQRLSYETHGEAYDLVMVLNVLLHQARMTIGQIQQAPPPAG